MRPKGGMEKPQDGRFSVLVKMGSKSGRKTHACRLHPEKHGSLLKGGKSDISIAAEMEKG